VTNRQLKILAGVLLTWVVALVTLAGFVFFPKTFLIGTGVTILSILFYLFWEIVVPE